MDAELEFFQGLGGKAEDTIPAIAETLPLFEDPDASTRAIYHFLNKFLEKEWVTYLPETIKQSLSRLGVVKVIPINMDRIGALQTIMNTENFWMEWHVFEKCCNAFCGNIVHFGHIQPLNISEIVFSVNIVRELDGEPPEISDEVQSYIAASARNFHWVVLPKPIAFAQKWLDELNINTGADEALKDAILKKWELNQDIDPLTYGFNTNSTIDMQLAKFFTVKEYMRRKDVLFKGTGLSG